MSPLAVLYFQTRPGPAGYATADLPFLRGYATALGHAFGLFLTSEQRYRELEEDWKRLQREGRGQAPEIIGDSEEVGRLRAELDETYLPATAARRPRPILVLGDTGTGKDLVARYLHYYSPPRSRAAFVECNCAGLSGDLVQTTLFGHVKGSFTGAVDSTPGLLRAADKGTLFLDEIGELPAAGQELLLKVLDHWTVRPVGETRTLPGGRAARLRHQPRPRGRRARRALPPRPLPAAEGAHHPPDAAGARGRGDVRPAAHALPGGGGEGPQEADARPHARGAARAAGLRAGRATCASCRASPGRSSRTRAPAPRSTWPTSSATAPR